MIEALILVVFPFCMVFAALSDMVSMTIANRVSLLLIGCFAVVAPFAGMDWTTIGMHVVAACLVLAVTFSLFAFGAMGGGDAKLMTATALWIGYSTELVQYLVYGAVVGGLLTLALVIYRNSPLAVYTGQNVLLRHFADGKAGIPYGVALGIAGLLVYPSTPLMQWVLGRLVG
jgi:prepilin peptidase CpaA